MYLCLIARINGEWPLLITLGHSDTRQMIERLSEPAVYHIYVQILYKITYFEIRQQIRKIYANIWIIRFEFEKRNSHFLEINSQKKCDWWTPLQLQAKLCAPSTE